jgi:SpoVK/Ycf46/Vps4 family AAA+-type ATPase
MRGGFCCLLSGPPGTGKTETVYQLARETGRDLIMVDISQTKSMWFGESEKRIKSIFDKYRSCVENDDITPILLFNEADAVLGKRKDTGMGGPAQTENAIQNIILQELENLNGIMIATTNLTGNLDKAFERRFLFKIQFEKPGTNVRAEIWQNMIPALSGEEALHIAERFDFSGGQIENVARKRTIESVLSGAETDFDDLIEFCKEESLESRMYGKIGFSVS